MDGKLVRCTEQAVKFFSSHILQRILVLKEYSAILETLNALILERSHFAKLYLISTNLAFPSLISNVATSVRVRL